MTQEKNLKLLEIMHLMHNDPTEIEAQWEIVLPLLNELVDTSPDGFEGTVNMINTHFNNAIKFNNVKVQQFELESGLIKLKTYLQKLNTLGIPS